jgi:hypothetical protein
VKLGPEPEPEISTVAPEGKESSATLVGTVFNSTQLMSITLSNHSCSTAKGATDNR